MVLVEPYRSCRELYKSTAPLHLLLSPIYQVQLQILLSHLLLLVKLFIAPVQRYKSCMGLYIEPIVAPLQLLWSHIQRLSRPLLLLFELSTAPLEPSTAPPDFLSPLQLLQNPLGLLLQSPLQLLYTLQHTTVHVGPYYTAPLEPYTAGADFQCDIEIYNRTKSLLLLYVAHL